VGGLIFLTSSPGLEPLSVNLAPYTMVLSTPRRICFFDLRLIWMWSAYHDPDQPHLVLALDASSTLCGGCVTLEFSYLQLLRSSYRLQKKIGVPSSTADL
jgi:hypothetical protein